MKRSPIAPSLLALVLALTLSVNAWAAGPDVRAQLEGTASYVLQTVRHPQLGSIGGEWAVLGLARSGYAVPQSYWEDYYTNLTAAVTACRGELHAVKYTEYSRVILALASLGADARDAAGYDLTLPLGDFEKTCRQGVNGPLWALLALDCRDYPMPQNPNASTQATRQMYLDDLLSRQLPEGGWSLSGGTADPDLTGMALQALAPYRDQAAVRAAVEKALERMSALQNESGGFSSWGSANLEGSAQMLAALCSLGIDLQDSRFVKNGHTILDDLLRYRQSDGSFLHTLSGEGVSQMATEQGLYALAAYQRFREGKSGLYTMDDVTIRLSGSGTSSLPWGQDTFSPQDAKALTQRILQSLDSSDPAALRLLREFSGGAEALTHLMLRRLP